MHNPASALASVYPDPRDQAILGQSPLLAQPRFGTLPELEVGAHRYLAAEDGLYLQARTHALNVCVRVSISTYPLPFGPCEEAIHLSGGLIPDSLIRDVFNRAVIASPKEYACLIMTTPVSSVYRLLEPTVFSHGVGHIDYDNRHHDPLNVALDLHTHGEGHAFFSATDDRDDLSGVHLSTVLGYCQSADTIQAITRVCIYGKFFLLNWNPW
jgi:PRTRC genetic system protein A